MTTVRARKQATNVTLRADAVVHAIEEAERAQWLKDNEEAIDYANAEVARRGLFSDRWRTF